MNVRLLSGHRVEGQPVTELSSLLTRDDGFVWVDVPSCDAEAIDVLSQVFHFHPRAVQDCRLRNHVPKFHAYPDHSFVVLHAPELGRGGHVHYIELDQFIGPNYLVTVHGPINPVLKPEVAMVETREVLQRIESAHLWPASPFELSYAIVSALIRRQEELVANLAQESGLLEQRVMFDTVEEDQEAFLEQLFKVWYELLAVRTMAGLGRETYARMGGYARSLAEAAQPLVADLADHFERVKAMADGQREFLHGVIEFYQARLNTRTSAAAERLATLSVQQNDDMRRITAWVAIIAVPTAVTGFFGQNVPYPGFGRTSGFWVSALLMLLIALALFVIFKRKDWL